MCDTGNPGNIKKKVNKSASGLAPVCLLVGELVGDLSQQQH
jgi:hypothetical protein